MIVLVPYQSSLYTGRHVVGSTREGGVGGEDLRWLGGGSPIRVSRESELPSGLKLR